MAKNPPNFGELGGFRRSGLKAGDAIRTRDIHLGKVTLYH